MDELLQTYARLTQRTVLRPAALPSTPPDIVTHLPSDTNAAIRSIEILLRAGQLDLLPDGEQFVRIVPVGWSNSPAASFLATIKPPTPVGEVRPAGVVNWSGSGGADLLQALEFLGKLRSRILLYTPYLNGPPLKLETVTALTRSELAYGLTVLLALNGVAAVDDGERFVQVVPIRQWKQVETLAPKAGPNDPLLAPETLPRFSPSPIVFSSKAPTPRPIEKLMATYAEIVGVKADPVDARWVTPVVFELTTPLSKAEVLYAIEASLKLSGFSIVKEEGGPVQVVLLEELHHRKESNPDARK